MAESTGRQKLGLALSGGATRGHRCDREQRYRQADPGDAARERARGGRRLENARPLGPGRQPRAAQQHELRWSLPHEPHADQERDVAEAARDEEAATRPGARGEALALGRRHGLEILDPGTPAANREEDLGLGEAELHDERLHGVRPEGRLEVDHGAAESGILLCRDTHCGQERRRFRPERCPSLDFRAGRSSAFPRAPVASTTIPWPLTMAHESPFRIALPAGLPALAHHQFLQQAFPSAKSHASGVKEVKLMFEGKADALFSTMRLMKADGSVIAEMTQSEASREMVMPTPTLSGGNYLVEYRVLATDGEVVKGDFFFTVDNDRT